MKRLSYIESVIQSLINFDILVKNYPLNKKIKTNRTYA